MRKQRVSDKFAAAVSGSKKWKVIYSLKIENEWSFVIYKFKS
jgi:hypothetical protein